MHVATGATLLPAGVLKSVVGGKASVQCTDHKPKKKGV